MIEGRLQTRSWTGQDNLKRYRTEIVGENLQLGPRPANTGQEAAPRSYDNNFNSGYAKPAPSQKFTSQSKPKADVEEQIPVINEDEPIIADNEIEETTVNLKDIPF